TWRLQRIYCEPRSLIRNNRDIGIRRGYRLPVVGVQLVPEGGPELWWRWMVLTISEIREPHVLSAWIGVRAAATEQTSDAASKYFEPHEWATGGARNSSSHIERSRIRCRVDDDVAFCETGK